MILVDMIGDRDLQIKRESYSTPWLTDVIWAAAKRLKHERRLPRRGRVHRGRPRPVPRGGRAGGGHHRRPGSYPPWHTAGDTLDKVSARSLQVVGDVLLEALPAIEKRLAARPAGRAAPAF